jgi:ABC-type uncharacterized transport system substrate-binding protein
LGARTIPVIGFLSTGAPEPTAGVLTAWRKALGEAGFVEGRNLRVEYRWVERIDEMPAFATELAGLRVDVIFVTSGFAAFTARAATTTIPIVFGAAVDPIGLGLADSIQRPGGNVTGVASSFDALENKRLQTIHELVPAATRIGYLLNPKNPNPALRQERLTAAGQTLNLKLSTLTASRPEELEAAFTAGAQAGIGALLVSDDPLFHAQAPQLIDLAARHSVPAIYPAAFFAAIGGLVGFGTLAKDRFYQAGTYVARILKGEKPAELPIVQPTKFELAINLKTAKALGLTVPQSLLARADEVIE